MPDFFAHQQTHQQLISHFHFQLAAAAALVVTSFCVCGLLFVAEIESVGSAH
jgi:hypothetical protein